MGRLASRRQALGAIAGVTSLLAAPAIVRAQSPLTVRFVQQRGLLYIPVDIMVAAAASCGRSDQARSGKPKPATALSGPSPI